MTDVSDTRHLLWRLSALGLLYWYCLLNFIQLWLKYTLKVCMKLIILLVTRSMICDPSIHIKTVGSELRCPNIHAPVLYMKRGIFRPSTEENPMCSIISHKFSQGMLMDKSKFAHCISYHSTVSPHAVIS